MAVILGAPGDKGLCQASSSSGKLGGSTSDVGGEDNTLMFSFRLPECLASETAKLEGKTGVLRRMRSSLDMLILGSGQIRKNMRLGNNGEQRARPWESPE